MALRIRLHEGYPTIDDKDYKGRQMCVAVNINTSNPKFKDYPYVFLKEDGTIADYNDDDVFMDSVKAQELVKYSQSKELEKMFRDKFGASCDVLDVYYTYDFP